MSSQGSFLIFPIQDLLNLRLQNIRIWKVGYVVFLSTSVEVIWLVSPIGKILTSSFSVVNGKVLLGGNTSMLCPEAYSTATVLTVYR